MMGPLGLRLHVPGDIEERIALIEQWDMTYWKKRVIKDGHIKPSEVDAVELEFKRFMALPLLFPGEEAIPSEKVDHLWHAFLLFTTEYRDFCYEVYGYFLDHVPNVALLD